MAVSHGFKMGADAVQGTQHLHLHLNKHCQIVGDDGSITSALQIKGGLHWAWPKQSQRRRSARSGQPRASSSIMRAAFSAIITVGELVLPLVIIGMIEASAMRRRPSARIFSRVSTTEAASAPIRQVPTG